MNVFKDVHIPMMMFVGPLLVLIVTVVLLAVLYTILFGKLLPKRLFDFLLGPVCLAGCYIWAIPMKMGFLDYFQGI